jgi:hypothetical protein
LDSSLTVELEGVTRVSDSETAQVLTEGRVEHIESVWARHEDDTRVDGNRCVPLDQSPLVDEGVRHR